MSQKSAIEKQPIIAKAAIHEGDTGSPEVQVALLTARINHLPEDQQERQPQPSWSVQDGRPPP